MNSTADLIRASLLSTRKELAEVFPHLSDDILGWAPAEEMRTIKGQIKEIIGTEIQIMDRLQGKPKHPYSKIEEDLDSLNTVNELIEMLTTVRTETLQFLESRTEEDLAASVEVSADTASYMELEQVPLSEMLRYLVRHESYHHGQLVSYLWAKGNNPYTWDS
ncbi:MAG: DinB family protein [Armatimonadota bacterium]